MSRAPLFSVTIKDCTVQTFRAGGKGGQNQNKVESGVRIIHRASGARGEARDSRDQLHNKRAAFRRMAETPKFRRWIRLEAARLSTGKTVEEIVDEYLRPENLRIEVRDEHGRWAEQASAGGEGEAG